MDRDFCIDRPPICEGSRSGGSAPHGPAARSVSLGLGRAASNSRPAPETAMTDEQSDPTEQSAEIAERSVEALERLAEATENLTALFASVVGVGTAECFSKDSVNTTTVSVN